MLTEYNTPARAATPHSLPLILSAQAQGESVIRKALTELQLWGLQRSFAFVAPTSASDGAGTRVASAAGREYVFLCFFAPLGVHQPWNETTQLCV